MEQPNPEPRVPWGPGVEKTEAFSDADTSTHPGLAHLPAGAFLGKPQNTPVRFGIVSLAAGPKQVRLPELTY